jgi:hypothetical protein
MEQYFVLLSASIALMFPPLFVSTNANFPDRLSQSIARWVGETEELAWAIFMPLTKNNGICTLKTQRVTYVSLTRGEIVWNRNRLFLQEIVPQVRCILVTMWVRSKQE